MQISKIVVSEKLYLATLNVDVSELLSSERAKHTISIFFLGILLYEKCGSIKESIDQKLKIITNNANCNDKNHNYPFTYLWFLICFYHDVATSFETDFDKLEEKIELEIPEFKDDLIPSFYKDIWLSYLRYRQCDNKLDHGIFGGLLFYNDMEKIFEQKKDSYEKESNVKITDEKWFIVSGLRWSKKILENIHNPIDTHSQTYKSVASYLDLYLYHKWVIQLI